jgi:cytosine/adenosine deaminase-related metal-dependent hydrolase
VAFGATAMGAREMLEVATLGGARVLGRDDIGALAPGMACDWASFGLDEPALAGAGHDPVGALLFCQSPQARTVVVQGRVLVHNGQTLTLELPRLVQQHRALARQLAQSSTATR